MDMKDLKNMTKTAIGKVPLLGRNNKRIGIKIFKSCHGRYLSAQPDGRVLWNREAAREWERITVEHMENDQIALKSVHGTYLSAQPDGRLEWNRDRIKIWERWTLESIQSGVTLKSAHNKYLSAHPDGAVAADRDEASEWEIFVISEP
jgi:hypothetical protein